MHAKVIIAISLAQFEINHRPLNLVLAADADVLRDRAIDESIDSTLCVAPRRAARHDDRPSSTRDAFDRDDEAGSAVVARSSRRATTARARDRERERDGIGRASDRSVAASSLARVQRCSREDGRISRPRDSVRCRRVVRRGRGARARTRASGEDEDEFAVFRFTLGIPGFDDEDVPRVVGALGAAGLFANRIVAGTDGASEALGRSETVGAALCLACAIAPELGRALKGGERGGGGRGSSATADGADGNSVFAMDENASEKAREDCAWVSYAVLTNTLASGVLFVDGDGRARLVRGTVQSRDDGAPDASKSATLARAGEAWSTASASVATEQYLDSRWEIDRAGANAWGFLSAASESVFARRCTSGGGGALIAWSDVPRAFTTKDRLWLGALADKLDRAFTHAA